jgi:hypothetical protein
LIGERGFLHIGFAEGGSMSEPEQGLGALRREWVAAQAVLAIVLLASVVAFVWIGLKPAPTLPRSVQASVPNTSGAQATSASQSQAQQFCGTTVTAAQNFGVVPENAKPTSDPQRTDIRGRYVCLATGPGGQYTISVDLVCRDLGDERCFDLFSVTQADGTSLFQRQQ